MLISDDEQEAIRSALDLIDLYKYTNSLKFGQEENDMLLVLLNLIDKLQKHIEGQDCIIETQAHNEEVLMEYFNRNTCLHCGKGKPSYCEDCYQELIALELEHQKINGELREEIKNLKGE